MTEKSLHIVCIDDEKDILEIARMSLEMVGQFKVTTFSNVEHAFAKIGELAADVVLIDCRMPGVSGKQAYHDLRKKRALRETPIVFMTARVQPQEVQEYLAMGAAGVIAKPFDPMKLAEQVHEIWSCAKQEKAQETKKEG